MMGPEMRHGEIGRRKYHVPTSPQCRSPDLVPSNATEFRCLVKPEGHQIAGIGTTIITMSLTLIQHANPVVAPASRNTAKGDSSVYSNSPALLPPVQRFPSRFRRTL